MTSFGRKLVVDYFDPFCAGDDSYDTFVSRYNLPTDSTSLK